MVANVCGIMPLFIYDNEAAVAPHTSVYILFVIGMCGALQSRISWSA